MQIGDLAKKAKTSIRTLRYYEEVGILFPTERSAGGFRRYTKDDFNKVLAIQRLKSLGLALHEIKGLFSIRKRSIIGGEAARKIYDFFEKKYLDVDEQIERLQQVKEDIEVSKELIKKCFDCRRKVNRCLKTCNIKSQEGDIPRLYKAVF